MGLQDEILKEAEDKMKRTIAAVNREFSEVRTGRASSSLVEGLIVDYYGTQTPLKQLSTISTPEPRLIVIQSWDTSIGEAIEQAILASDLGLTPNRDGKLIRLTVPPLTNERREELTRLVRKMAEDGRISIRTVRRDAKEKIESLKRPGHLTEDEAFKAQEHLQKLTDRHIESIDNILKSKERDLLEI